MKQIVNVGLLGYLLLVSFNSLSAEITETIKSRWFNKKTPVLNEPIDGLSDEEQDEFIIGRSFFTIPWVAAPSATTARDGLGPLFNANTCVSCHRGNGVGEKFNYKGELSRAVVTKLSLPSGQSVPHYGGQIAVNGLINVPFEAMPTLSERTVKVTYPDGKTVMLKQPTYGLHHLNYGQLAEKTIIVQRRAPALVGLGLLSQVSDEMILAHADAEDSNNDGISGRPNWVADEKGTRRLGRFTAKASVPTVLEQVAAAAANDLGLTNPLFPNELCTATQTACQQAEKGRPAPNGETLDLPMHRLVAITNYLMHNKVPVKPENQWDKKAKQGQSLFHQVGCMACHIPNMKTAKGVAFSPYTDLLLHDMGEGLADNRKAFSASGREFRTAPLWGISTYAKTLASKTPYYLHDGRAATLEEAILWHGGEAEKSKKAFMALPEKQRRLLLHFLNFL